MLGRWTQIALVGALLAVGCERTEDVTPPPVSPPPAPSADDGTTNGTGATTGAASDATAAASSQAQTLIDQAMTYIKENKLDLAEQTVTKLEGMKSSLSPTLQSAVDKARQALDAAKASAAKAPAVPAAPTAPATPAAPQ